ncbi:MAG: CRISPR-associated endonuclease Cas2 [Candidatus Diapherotrites archaeon]|uniref:CRISPR-associated endoribonuclease Cas2 n=1 Tax=Candidatus Iainarchaeum sp. TaxID=3101447 RepID=A0A8T3YLG9_9ARCH|nr:CRISPR-associated endonuclease Cas2 [Candidatus Diapherotrites archaeon]
MIYFVIYDITSNSKRQKVSEQCKNFGLKRIQKSAFCGPLTKNLAEMLGIKCKEIIEAKDCVFVIPACTNCFKAKIIVGEFDESKFEDKDFEIVD